MILMSYKAGTHLWTDDLRDFPYNDDAWADQVRERIKDTALEIANPDGFRNHGTADLKIGIIGAKKDDSSFYLDMFPEYALEEVELTHMIHATDIRKNFLRHGLGGEELVPHSTYDTMRYFALTGWYKNLREWQFEIDANEQLWSNSPYPVKQVTADAIVEYKDRVLLVKRGKQPGKGLWAVPGGHVNVDERVEAAAIRELREETMIPLSDRELHDRIIGKAVFDAPGRSTIGRVITHAAHIDLSDLPEEPGVVGTDDAEEAMWAFKDTLTEDMFYDDHWHMISYFVDL